VITPVHAVAPYVHVANVERSIQFYELLGFKIAHTLKNDKGKIVWANVQSGQSDKAVLMLALASEPIVASQQAVLFYMYVDENLAGLREHLLANKIEVPAINYPPYMEEGELRVTDPDGYVSLVGQTGNRK
jgi:hypothetical protein